MMRPSTWKLFPRYVPSVQRQIGEGSGGRSPTLPTFSRLMSSRTRIEWQKGHTVWAALDHRNWTGAPQLGQLPAGWLIKWGRSPTCLLVFFRRSKTCATLAHLYGRSTFLTRYVTATRASLRAHSKSHF